MTNDIKAVARWECRVATNASGRPYVDDMEFETGRYLLFTDHERVVAELRAEIEALAKDAGRYRWLQKQTPYRFGKIQAACVIDAVDTLYFKADEFDAQIDAEMENGNV